VKIPAGSHTFYSEDKQAGAVVDIEPGKEYFFRTDLQTGFWKGHFRLTMVMPEQGKFDIAKLKPSESTESKHELPVDGAFREPAATAPASNVRETNKTSAPGTQSATQAPN